VDPGRLQQLCDNLVRNAVDHVGGDFTVTIGELQNGFDLEDDGPGILEEELDRIVTEGHSTSHRRTGLGLRIVRQVVDSHGWDLLITEGSEGGARFEITGVEFGVE
jgi:signal transduction histidine kinase